ncbi:MAG: hypothetical protein P8Y45_01825 [Exilibacterium sp.]
MNQPFEHSIEDKVAFLSCPQSYPDAFDKVDVIETHLSWLFQTPQYVYKLKKPLIHVSQDLTSLAARHRNCLQEVRLNRRLAAAVYLGAVPLSADVDGDLHLGPQGTPVDWLVHMRRLPTERMLDTMIKNDRVHTSDLFPIAHLLAEFYNRAKPVQLSGEKYRKRLLCGIRQHCEPLLNLAKELPLPQLERVLEWQTQMLHTHARLFDQRMEERHLIEAHGDLKPEHLCLLTPPVIIDCLEFSLDLRTLDPVDELCFLTMECDKLGAPFIGEMTLKIYSRLNGDHPPLPLLQFYKSYRALWRAKLAALHLDERPLKKSNHWRQLVQLYLSQAEHYFVHAP